MERWKGGVFEPLCFPPIIFLYSTVFLKVEEQSKIGPLLVIKRSISSLPLKGFQHNSVGWDFLFFKTSPSSSGDNFVTVSQSSYQKATKLFLKIIIKKKINSTISVWTVSTSVSNKASEFLSKMSGFTL